MTRDTDILIGGGGMVGLTLALALAQKAASSIPNARFKIYPEDGHYSLPLLRVEEMTSELLGASQSRTALGAV